MFDGFQIIHPAWTAAPLGINRCAHVNLDVDASVVTLGFHGLGDQQDGNQDQTEAAESSQRQISTALKVALLAR